MKKYILQYKPFLIFLLKFFLSYLILTVLYQFYLNSYDETIFEVDSFTTIVANHTEKTIEFFGHKAEIKPNLFQSSINLFVENRQVARVVEGCNALSVIILFIAFVIAFKGRFKTTLLYILGGSILIYILNIIRIALIAIALYHYPQHEHLLHGVLFPLFIYGVVFLLWVIWVNKFSVYAKK